MRLRFPGGLDSNRVVGGALMFLLGAGLADDLREKSELFFRVWSRWGPFTASFSFIF